MEKKKALVIDDERIVLDSVSRILKDENFRVDTCSSGLKGLKRAVEKSYDIVFTDLRMPISAACVYCGTSSAPDRTCRL